MKNCLFITTQFPYPLDNGGKIGAYNGICVVSASYKLTVLSFSEEQQFVDEGIQYFKKNLPTVTFDRPIKQDIHIRKKPLELVKTMARDFSTNTPYVTVKFYNKAMFNRIDIYFNQQNWDLVFIDYLNMALYGDYIREKYSGHFGKIILKDHNIEYELVKQEYEKSNGLKKAILQSEWEKTYKYECEQIEKADLVFSVCDENTEFLKRHNSNSYTMLPTYMMLPARKIFEKRPRILFMGNLSWGANMEGLQWFVDKVLPIVKKLMPEVKLTVVGSGPVENPFESNDSVDYLGYVKDISHIYDDQKVFIVPLFEGSGIRIKILDAFNNEIPVVSTTLGCGTIGAEKNKELLIADDDNDFANLVTTLLQNENLCSEITCNAKKFLREHYSLENRQNEFKYIVTSQLDDKHE